MPDIPKTGVAFLLTQLGTRAAERFAEAVAELDLTPPLVGILRIVRAEPGLSQLELARRIGVVPSRVVTFVDELERRGLVQRTRDAADRRVNLLTLTADGVDTVTRIGRVARTHESRLTASLSADERRRLLGLLTRIADDLGLEPGIHPGYRHL